ncbi:MAG: hypothetical protein BWY85_00801 [Firmicutes bacterium ADurb.Bin506]|nr:MAG: hypothetical protein BWY85_00801 [Firmicutes bacterium ADurb.Bin506]
MRLAPFVIASVIGRAARFFLEAVMLLKFGDHARELLGSRFDLITMVAAGVVIIVFLIAGRLGRLRPAAAANTGKAPSHPRPAAEQAFSRLRHAVRPGSHGRRVLERALWVIAALVFLAIIIVATQS